MKYFYINNNKINYIPNNRSIIEYCENLGIDIPHYCYHPKLSIAGNCRMCLVEVKGSPKPVISCAMSLLNKMEIYTDSPLVKKSREGVLEFLLLNHPLDCPVCDQGGECDLQDQSFVFGINKKRFFNFKRVVTDKNIGPIVKTVMTRCIHCTRCVRFSTEVAGTEQLGVYGRGMNSEIGTYVTKIFNSELSGNVIDICPVGALTSKQYPFIGRIWELKNIKSVDYSDSSLTNVQLYLKSNSVVKVLPGFDNNMNTNNWISDKTRFSFDGMFSPERLSNINISGGKDNNLNLKSWVQIFDEIIQILYFQDHLSKHGLINSFKSYIVFNNNIELESLIMLISLAKKYPFINLRKAEKSTINNDIESKFLINSFNSKNLSKSDLCLLFNVNTRYENPNLNIQLRQRFLKGNFNIFSLNGLTDYTYPVVSLGSTVNTLTQIAEGNNIFCQELVNSLRPTIFLSSELSKRQDFKNLTELLFSLKININLCNSNWNGFNYVSISSNETGLNSIKVFKELSITDLVNSSNIFFIDNDFNNSNINKLIELKLLNYFATNSQNRLIVELHNVFKHKFLKLLKQNFNSSTYISLPNKVFFEQGLILQNNTGIYTKTINVLNSITKAKTNWQIIRKLNSYLENVSFQNKNLLNINFEFLNTNQFYNFISFQYLPVNSLNSHNVFYKTSVASISFLPLKDSKNKYFDTKTKFWLDDFYIGSKDLYSKFSLVMVECSKSFRLESTNFNYIN